MQRLYDRILMILAPLPLFFRHLLLPLLRSTIVSKLIQKFSYLTSRKDFVLRVARIPKKYRYLATSSYPPPGYGSPSGKENGYKQPKNPYGLFLYPARIARSFLYLCTAIYIFTLPPILSNALNINSYYIGFITILITILLLTALTYIAVMRFSFRRMAPIFTDAWRLWPESQYNLFLTVPHIVEISWRDKSLTKHKYWHPDKQTALSHQSSEYLQGMHTVQEVLLNLGIFELFFYKNDETSIEDNSLHRSIRIKHWFIYYFWPVWTSYFIIIGIIAIYQMTNTHFDTKSIPLFNFPANIIVAAFIWLIWSIQFVWSRIEYLRLLHKDVKNGVYESHLELVPQKILSSITKIPHEQQIITGINHLQNILHIVQIAAFTNIMIILEVLSNSQS